MSETNKPGDVGGITAAQLRAYLERIEALEQEKAEIATAVREVFAEAKANGFETKIMRQVLKLRKLDPHDRAEQEALLELYCRAVGLVGTPLGDYADGASSGADRNDLVTNAA